MSARHDGSTADTACADASLEEAKPAAGRFLIVGIGASAGGLAAFEAFFSGMPPEADTGMAFVVVQHLAPDHESHLTELVKRCTRMDVFQVEQGMVVKPNCIYIIPPNSDLALSNGVLQLLEPVAPRGHRLAIDFFFRSLAQDQRERAVCIVLAGTGADGSQGLRAIKAEGGLVLAQNPDSTEYGAMPRSAISTGLVDYTLPPAEMPAQLVAYAAHQLATVHGSPEAPAHYEAAATLEQIFSLLRAQIGHDFSQYKEATVTRRIERRIAVQSLSGLDAYLRFLQETPAEATALFRDLLIGVTRFFRDPEAFAALEQQMTALVATRPPRAVIRVWSPGCSSGEEAYSLAILLRELMDGAQQSFKLQVFATDIDSRAIAIARVGRFPATIAADISPARLARFFVADGDGYRIQQSIRDTLVFSEHDVIQDPPFSRLDLISCRNLLIYLGSELQQKLLPLFHYALSPDGLLFLGTSETVGASAGLFAALDAKAKLYQRKAGAGDSSRCPTPNLRLVRVDVTAGAAASAPRGIEPTFRQLTERALLRRSAVGALVNAQSELLYVHGRTGSYLGLAPGEASANIVKSARDGLRLDLATALHRAASTQELVTCANVRLEANGDSSRVNLTVEPIRATPDSACLFLVTFEAAPVQPASPATAAAETRNEPAADVDSRLRELQLELHARDEHLRFTFEQCQTANEALKSSNEELQSTNEELQSTNEELETSKEELQSVNEELATVNAELETTVAGLSRANNDMNNLLAGTGVGTLFVDQQLCIQRFTPAATQLINLIRSDLGRPLAHVVSNFVGYDRLVLDVQEVLDSLSPKDVEATTISGACYLLRIRPYRTLENVVEGVVITFTELSELKRAQAVSLEVEALRRMAAVMRDAHDAITVQDLNGKILAWNKGAIRMYGWSEEEALTMNIRDLIPEAEREQALLVIQRLLKSEVLEPYKVQRLTKAAKLVNSSLTATALVNESGAIYAVSTIERELKKATHA